MSDMIQLGHWLYDEKEEPDLASQDEWRRESPSRPLGRQGEPVLVSRSLLKSGHTHIRGKTGSGKTSMALMPLITQLMRPYTLRWKTTEGKECSAEERDVIVVIDLGGDKALFNTVKQFADEDSEREFRFLTLDPNHSHKLDPFQSIPEDGHRIIRLCNLFLESFSLDHGLMYGGSWYSQRNLLLLLSVCEQLIAAKRGGSEITLREVDRYLQDPKVHNIRDAEQIRGIFRFLLEYPQLMPEPGEVQVIDFKRAITNREVIFLSTPSISEATTARQIAGLALYSTVNAAMTLYEARDFQEDGERPHPHVHLIVDEFQQIAGSSFEALLTGARKYGISLYMSHQTTESLQTRDLDLSATVRDNSTVKLYFTVTGKRDIDELITFSRETTRRLRSQQKERDVRRHGRSGLAGESESEQVTSQLSKSEILDISASAGACFAIIEDGLGHREPIPLQTRHLLSEEAYLKQKATPIPRTSNPDSPPLVVGVRVRRPAWEEAHLNPDLGDVRGARFERFEALLGDLEREEQIAGE